MMDERPEGLEKAQLDQAQQALWEQLDAELKPLVEGGALSQARDRLTAALATMGEGEESAHVRARLLSRRAEFALDLDDGDAALDDAESAIRLGLRDAATYGVCGWAYFHLDKPEQARVCFDQALSSAPDEVTYLTGRALVLMELDELDEARSDLTQALHHNDQDAELLGLRGEVYILLGDLESATKDLEKALSLAPDGGEFALSLARLKTINGDVPAALAVIDVALDENEDFAFEALLLRSHLRLLSGQSKPARADAIRASNIYSDEAFSFVQLAHVELAEGNVNLAKTAAQRAVLLDPSLSDSYLVRGAAHQMAGNAEAAKEDFERARRAPAELPLFLLGPAYEVAGGPTMGFDASILDLLTGKDADFDPASFDPTAFAQAFSGAGGAGSNAGGSIPGMGNMDPMQMLNQVFDDSGNIRGPLKPFFKMAFKNAPKIMKNLPDSMLGGISKEELEKLDLSELSGEELEARMREFYQLMKSGKNPFDSNPGSAEE